jgi:hypothetical protein
MRIEPDDYLEAAHFRVADGHHLSIELLWKNYHNREGVYGICKTNLGNSLFRQ